MKSASTSSPQNRPSNESTQSARHRNLRTSFGVCSLTIALFLTGCQGVPSESKSASAKTGSATPAAQPNADALILREGDVLKITFPGAPNLDVAQTIRRDGKIALTLVGEVQAAGLTPSGLQAELIKQYAPQLVSKEILVSVVSSSIPVFMTGAVLRPGKIVSDHPITALEAIMEAGGPDYARANLKAVVIIRQEADGKTRNIVINVKQVIEGKSSEPFYLKPSDIVYVPEGFSIF